VLADAQNAVDLSPRVASTVTVPPNSSVPFPVGTEIEITQQAAGQILLAPGAGVSLHSPEGKLGTRLQYSTVVLRKTATDTWIVRGDVASQLPFPILAWPADEGTGTVVNDLSGNGHNGVASASGWVTGNPPHAKGASGDASNPAVYSSGHTLLTASRTGTLMCTVKAINLTGTGDLLEIKSSDGSTYLTIYRPTSTSLQVEAHDSGGSTTDTTPYGLTITGQILKIGAVLSTSKLQLYVGGLLVEESDVTGTGTLGTISFISAGGTDTKPNQGVVNDVRMFAEALTAEQMAIFAASPM